MKPLKTFTLLALHAAISWTAATAQTPDFGKSYINVTKGINGGTVETGDVLEIRASFVVRAGTFDSCSYTDVLPAGTSYIAGTMRVLTNEGKIYKQFTDAIPDDEGWYNGGNIRINLGYQQTAAPATRFRRGRVANNHRPSFYNSACIMIASFRVQVTAATGSILSTGGGSMTYKNGTNPVQTHTFPVNRVAVYTNYGICSNTVGVNSLGTEFNGTFGSGKPRNRGTSGNVPVGYTYNTFSTNSPQDYYYGVANNTSTQNYTTSNAWPKPDNAPVSRRVFSVWDIIGDHTGAASLTAGNPAADTVTQSNGGYMLVINAAYRIDSAFQQTISGLCPNTYYEISCWMRNICSKCGCDSAGRGASNAGYIPTAAGDSSGVSPNITFEVDGIDYYTTGNLLYSGQWVKKGFTFRTGPNQSSFTLKFFNNAPGGGGNDWALDDISVATCSPDLIFTPTNNPTICRGNVVNIGCIVKSYFDNYTNYKWQKSIDNGVTWTNTGIQGTGTPVWNGSEWQYNISYPSFVATAADSGIKYKVVVATTVSNLSNSACAFTEVGSVITLTIIDCGAVLTTEEVAFNASREGEWDVLSWKVDPTSAIEKTVVETSEDGKNFLPLGEFEHQGGTVIQEPNRFNRPHGNKDYYYRIKVITAGGQSSYTRILKLGNGGATELGLSPRNPFGASLEIDLQGAEKGALHVRLLDASGRVVHASQYEGGTGRKMISVPTGSLANGVYTVQAELGTRTVTRKVIKVNSY